jgi:predicted nucleic acid-binding protein
MNAVDTNVLIYAHDPRDPRKQAIAAALIESLTDAALVWQVACEYLSASKKLLPLGYGRDQAWLDIRDLRLVWATVLPNWDVMDRAQCIFERHGLSYWDSMIVGRLFGIRRDKTLFRGFCGTKR